MTVDSPAFADEADAPRFDVVITGGRVIDPASSRDGSFDVGVSGDRITAVGHDLTRHASTQVIDVKGALVCPGLIDLHTHVYEHATDVGIAADDAGVHAGATTLVDQGSTGAWMFPGFRAQVIDASRTEVKAFLNIFLIGAIQGKRGGPSLLTPEFCDPDAIVRMHARFPHMISGIKTYGESGSFSFWDGKLLSLARSAADQAEIPLYVHTGELLDVDEARRPSPRSVLPRLLQHVVPGDVLAHCYSTGADGILGDDEAPSEALIESVHAGVRLDVGHGVNFCFDTARRMLAAGLVPHTISSDAHGALGDAYHDDSTLDHSLVGAMSKLLALGLTLTDVIRATTHHPAQVLHMEHEIGTLAIGSRADLTILDLRTDDWRFFDSRRAHVDGRARLVPTLVLRAGNPIVPSRRLLRDVLSPEERGESPGARTVVGEVPCAGATRWAAHPGTTSDQIDA